jgi:NDP-sugar pyrophosphorylase family protein
MPIVDKPVEQIIPHIIIPCAGSGTRFKEQGCHVDKPLIPVGGRRMLDWVLDVIPEAWHHRIIAVVRESQVRLRDELENRENGRVGKTGTNTCVVPGPTQGAACTVLAAAVGLPPGDPVLIMNADQYVKCDLEATIAWAMEENLDGFILTFPGTGPAWSYAVTNGHNRVVHVIEKKQVSEHATCGIYWWRRAGDLVHAICSMIATGEKTRNEFYLAPAFNFAPLSEKDVRIVTVEEFHGLGTPEQVKAFEAKLAEGWKP